MSDEQFKVEGLIELSRKLPKDQAKLAKRLLNDAFQIIDKSAASKNLFNSPKIGETLAQVELKKFGTSRVKSWLKRLQGKKKHETIASGMAASLVQHYVSQNDIQSTLEFLQSGTRQAKYARHLVIRDNIDHDPTLSLMLIKDQHKEFLYSDFINATIQKGDIDSAFTAYESAPAEFKNLKQTMKVALLRNRVPVDAHKKIASFYTELPPSQADILANINRGGIDDALTKAKKAKFSDQDYYALANRVAQTATANIDSKLEKIWSSMKNKGYVELSAFEVAGEICKRELSVSNKQKLLEKVGKLIDNFRPAAQSRYWSIAAKLR